ncbi:hypothetical protein [Dyella sp. C11]|uniref:hypothetical protein n=1 Tax=Dyella sp. C11 TaxID=2126991 RepID=UPI000D644F65|nr:hypothetical protein [Dyella sp. C11]
MNVFNRSIAAGCAWLAAALALPAWAEAPTGASVATSTGGQLAVQVNDDRMTISVAKVPQVYLYGPIDAGAAQRVEAMIQSHKIPAGSDIYLNSPGGDANAGMALGRLFRANNIGTHLGSPRRVAGQPVMSKESQCVDACAYAYVGGLYRWSASGADRFGGQPVAGTGASAPAIHDYLKEMGINPLVFGNASTNGTVTWLDGDLMLGYGVANNGRLPPKAVNQPVNGIASLSLTQTTRDGEHSLTMMCRNDGMTVTATYTIGADHAKQIAARATQYYFEIDHQPATERQRASVSAVGQSVVFTQPFTEAQLQQLTTARSISAYLSDKGGAVRYGFWMELDPVRNELLTYTRGCQQIAKAMAAQPH